MEESVESMIQRAMRLLEVVDAIGILENYDSRLINYKYAEDLSEDPVRDMIKEVHGILAIVKARSS